MSCVVRNCNDQTRIRSCINKHLRFVLKWMCLLDNVETFGICSKEMFLFLFVGLVVVALNHPC